MPSDDLSFPWPKRRKRPVRAERPVTVTLSRITGSSGPGLGEDPTYALSLRYEDGTCDSVSMPLTAEQVATFATTGTVAATATIITFPED
jgi:hypothetical protein